MQGVAQLGQEGGIGADRLGVQLFQVENIAGETALIGQLHQPVDHRLARDRIEHHGGALNAVPLLRLAVEVEHHG